jgi:hypothetical protein
VKRAGGDWGRIFAALALAACGSVRPEISRAGTAFDTDNRTRRFAGECRPPARSPMLALNAHRLESRQRFHGRSSGARRSADCLAALRQPPRRFGRFGVLG